MSDKIAVKKKKMSEKDDVLKRSMFYLGKKKKTSGRTGKYNHH